MKRRVLSLIVTLALCLNLCPVWVLAVDEAAGAGLCPHHPAHMDECGYVPPSSEKECIHNHDDGCYAAETVCLHEHTAGCCPDSDYDPEMDEPDLCAHTCTEDDGCIVRTLSCPHEHDGECGYAPESSGAPCMFVCKLCPINDLIGKLPNSVSMDNSEQVEAQLNEIYDLYDELTEDEQAQVDLSLCISLQNQLDETIIKTPTDGGFYTTLPVIYILESDDKDGTISYEINTAAVVDTNGFTLLRSESTAILVTKTGKLYLKGTVRSLKGAGVEVQSGGFLSITEPGTIVTGSTYGLDIASGTEVQLAAGTFTGVAEGAIHIQNGNDFAALLEPGCAYFDINGQPILPADVAGKTKVVVGQCDHSGKGYTRTSGAPTHTWNCPYCGAKKTESCTFTFDGNGNGTCSSCGNALTITVDESTLGDLVYDGNLKPGTPPPVTVTLSDGTVLTEGTDYKIDYKSRTDVGEITVTVTGITFNGTFTKTYHVEQDEPGISWDAATRAVNYDGLPVDELPDITITIKATEDLHPYLQYFYRKVGETEFISGLPTNAGEYEVKAYIPESQNYKAAETGLLTLTIDKIPAVTTAPTAKTLTYNREAQQLVTAGVLAPGAIAEGAKIEFKLGTDGTYSMDIPTGIGVSGYRVYYRVADTENYRGVSETLVKNPNTTYTSARINHREITPTVELEYSSTLYDGGDKEPKVTVKDGDYVIPSGEYTVVYTNNRNVGENATVTVSNAEKGNYKLTTATATFKITDKEQAGLSITGKPAHVCYGDKITTLGTTGGTGTGTVKWSLSGGPNSTIDPNTGVLTVKDTGSITIKAERTVDNYVPVSDTWTFTVEPKPVTAEVTIASKVYDGTTDIDGAAITATVSDVVAGDSAFTVTGIIATYDDPDVGTNKPVTVKGSGVTGSWDTTKYTVVIPTSATADINAKVLTSLAVTLSDHDLKTDANGNYYIFDGNEKNPTVAVTGTDADSETWTLTANDYTAVTTNNKNVSTDTVKGTVTVTAKAGGNFSFDDETVDFEIRKNAAALTKAPQAKDLTYDGTVQDLVDVGTATGGKVVYSLTKEETEDKPYSETIPQETNAGTYTVYYKVVGDTNHEGDTTPSQVSVTIKPKAITAIIALTEGGNPVTTSTYIYDGSAKEPTVTVTGGVDSNPIAATEYTVFYSNNVNAGTATVIVVDNNGGNYIVSGTATFVIAKKDPTVTPPTAKTGLKYNGSAQELITAGEVTGGTMLYCLTQNGTYSTAIPTAAAVGDYTIWYKVQGDLNYSDVAPTKLTTDAKIDKNTVTNPTITISSETFKYNGSQQKPTITVYDDNSRLIPANEYTATITNTTDGDAGIVSVGIYTVTITTPSTSNYVITANNTRSFEIVEADQETITITGTQTKVQYGDVIQLGTTGGIGGSTVKWEIEGATNTTITQTGLLTVKDVNTAIKVTVTRTVANYGDVSATWEFTAAKKPVTAVVTADDRPYKAGDKATTVHAEVPSSELVFGDNITIDGVTGEMDDPNVGTNKMVTITGGTISDTTHYDVTIPKTTTVTITAEAATVDTDPSFPSSLTYDASQSQALVTGSGTVTGGTLVFSLDENGPFSSIIPTGKDAGTYTVYFKAKGDSNHTDSEVKSKTVTIDPQPVTLTLSQIELSPSGAKYDGKEHKPTTVTLWDSQNNVIPTGEYEVTYDTTGNANWIDKGTYTVKIANKTGGNYVVGDATAPFTISTTEQNPLTITNKPGLVYYGDTFTLSAVGGSGSGTVKWSVDEAGKSVLDIDPANGTVKIKGVGQATITATKEGGTNYETATAEYPFNAVAKPVTVTITADDKPHDGNTNATIHVTLNGLVKGDTINTNTLNGTFDNPNVGQNKTVNINGTLTDTKYEFTIPATTTASIYKAEGVVPSVSGASGLEYTGNPQNLVTGGDANTLYSDSRDGVYSTTVPTGTNAGTYTVWFKAEETTTHNESAPKGETVTISRKELTTSLNIELSGNDLQIDTQEDGSKNYSYVYDGNEKKPTVTIRDGNAVVSASEYEVNYGNNKNVSTETVKGTVTITSKAGGNYTFDEQTVTFEITQAGAQLTKSPEAKNLTYIGPNQEQELVTTGTATGGHIEYSLNGADFSPSIPKGETAGTYTVTYKVVGDGNYTDSTETWTVSVIIKPKEVISPKITVDPGTYFYTGNAVIPTAVKVEDGTTEIPTSEYRLEYRNNVNAGSATVVVINNNSGNYIVNGTADFTITKANDASVKKAPDGKTDLQYNGSAQELVTAGEATGGTLVYALDKDGPYSPVIPTGTAVGSYTVWYKVEGDSNHEDTAPVQVEHAAVIGKNEVTNPTILVEPNSATFNNKKQNPTVTIKDNNGVEINGSEYTATFTDLSNSDNTDLTQVGTYTVTIAATSSSNYDFTNNTKTATFEILPADQTALTITGTRERVYYGDKIQLGTTGGVSGGTIEWNVEGKDASNKDIATLTSGLLTITGVGSVKVTATSKGSNYTDQTATWSFYAEKKPVTAVVTATSRPYSDGDTDTTVTATLQSSDLVNGDEKVTFTLSGSFDDPNAGTNKTVKVDSTSPGFPGGKENIYDNYSITYPATTTASIFKADVTNVTAPTAEDAANLMYTGLALPLVKPGSSTEGTLEYSTDNITYSASLPTGTDAKAYEVWYRVKGDSNHNDTTGTQLEQKVTIAQQEVKNPTIEFMPTGATYDSKEHKPAVTVKDNNGCIIPDPEYTVTYEPATDWVKAGEYTVKVENNNDKANGNYNISQATKKFTIHPAGQNPFEITGKPGKVYYGDSFTLSTTGGSGTGAVAWDSSDKAVATINQNGLVTVYKSGSTKIIATKASDTNYGVTTAEWTFSAEKKPVKAIVTAKNKVFDENDTATLEISWKDGDLLGNDANAINLVLTGKFDSPDVGTNKTVTITGTAPTSDKYDISWNTTTTASITPAAASVTQPGVLNLTYNGGLQNLITAGTPTNGTIYYSLDNVIYSGNIPQGKNAGTYTVWYKVEGNANYADVAPQALPVTISPKELTSSDITIELSPESFDYDGSPKKPDVTVKFGSIIVPASEYTVTYSNNIAIGTNTAKVTITNADGGNYIVSGTKNFTIKAGAATLTERPTAQNLTYNGKLQELVIDGTAVNGQVVYADEKDGEYTLTIPTGEDAGSYTVWYKVKGNQGYGDTTPRSLTVTIKPKPITPMIVVTNAPAKYTGGQITPVLLVNADNKMLTSSDYNSYCYNNTNVGTATVMVWSTDNSNYQFSTTVTFEIVKEAAKFTTNPTPAEGLVYTGKPQKLVNPGIPSGGTIVLYSLDCVTFSALIPTGTEIDTYTVYAKVQGDSSHSDSDVVTISGIQISQNPITAEKLTATLSPGPYKFTGSEIKPTVTLTDDKGNIIPAEEYTVDYSNNTGVGAATVTITGKGKNYAAFTVTKNFTITEGDKPALTITGKPEGMSYYGDTFTLSTTGGSDSGTVQWSATGPVDDLGGGQFKITGSGKVTITATKTTATRDANSANTATWEFYAYAKPVTATVTAKNKPYDNKTDVELTVIVNSGLVDKDAAFTLTAQGHFVDTSVGTQTVIIDSVTVSDDISKKYDISWPATVTANITAATAKVTEGNAPTAKTGLQYTGEPLELVNKGEATGGRIKYSLDGETFTYALPKGTDAGSYTVWYKVVADDDNYKDSAVFEVDGRVEIGPNTTTPTVDCKFAMFTGSELTPKVTVTVGGRTLSEDEYTVEVDRPAIAVGDYTVTVTDKANYGNYEFGTATGTFKIVSADQNPVSIINKPANVCYGDTFRLSATGGSGNGAIKWGSTNENVAQVNDNGEVKIVGVGSFEITAYRAGAGGYSNSNIDTAPFVADKKTVTPTVTAENKSYDGEKTAKLKAVWKTGDLVPDDIITLTINDGTFETADVGTNKTVTFAAGAATGNSDVLAKYDIKWPESTTASIYKVDAKIETAPKANPGTDNQGLTFTGEPLTLVTGGTTVGNIGTVVYSLSQNGVYSETIPTATNAGWHSVWYKVADSVNYTGVAPAEIRVEIKKATPEIKTKPTASSITSGQPLSASTFTNGGTAQLGNRIVEGTFAWVNGDLKPEVGTSEQNVIFKPKDTDNYNEVTFQIEVTITALESSSNSGGGDVTDTNDDSETITPSEDSVSLKATVQNGAASTALSTTSGSRLVREAVANQSKNVVIKPEITSNVTKTEVSIPASTVRQIESETDAALTVSTPIADVTLPNAALNTLSSAGGTVDVVTEQVEQGIALTLTAGGKNVESVPGGLTITVPVEDAGSGTVAVLVHDDGARETIRKSIVEDDKMTIPLNGSATVEIVDNSKDFTDVPSTNWASDAVAFASAHELFNGTSETTFSPDQPMSRGMLATVLYNLEGCPDQELTSEYSDVSSDAWYADGVSWAAANGITGGYGNGQFGPNDDVTREQFAVMLWKYAGSPEASGKDLDFADADQASDYALEALSWAVENGILSGYGNGQLDPGGTATRAQAAQMLKNFMENV